MKVDLKSIHIGWCIRERVEEKEVSMERICKFLKTTESEVEKMYKQDNLDTGSLLRWSKLLKYDFFRIYTQHLIMFAPEDGRQGNGTSKKMNSSLPQFRKNIYTKELISFILELIKTGKKTKLQVIQEYGIPKTTLYKWVEKYQAD